MSTTSGWCNGPPGARPQHDRCIFTACPCGCHDDECRCDNETTKETTH